MALRRNTNPTDLHREIERLQRQASSLRRWLSRSRGLDAMLKRRGLVVQRGVSAHRLLMPSGPSRNDRDRYYGLLHRYSFRLLLRDIIRLKAGFGPEELSRYCSTTAARDYLNSLEEFGLVARNSLGKWRLTRPSVSSFGETLEWFIAEVLKREFFAQTLHSVSFRTPPPGGDFDVLAAMEGLLVYVEVKSSPPRGIEIEEARGFLKRRQILAPHVSLFFVDTHLRMKDKMVPMFQSSLDEAAELPDIPSHEMHKVEGELFQAGHKIYLLNASKGVLRNLRCCLMDYFRYGNPPTAI